MQESSAETPNSKPGLVRFEYYLSAFNKIYHWNIDSQPLENPFLTADTFDIRKVIISCSDKATLGIILNVITTEAATEGGRVYNNVAEISDQTGLASNNLSKELVFIPGKDQTILIVTFPKST